eukprot:9478841-Pyramimonas_sp.AAC.1
MGHSVSSPGGRETSEGCAEVVGLTHAIPPTGLRRSSLRGHEACEGVLKWARSRVEAGNGALRGALSTGPH